MKRIVEAVRSPSGLGALRALMPWHLLLKKAREGMFLSVGEAAERFKIPMAAYEDWEAGEAYPEEGAEEKLVYAYFPWLSGQSDLLEKDRAACGARIEASPPLPSGAPEFDSVEEAIRFAEKQGRLIIVEDEDGPLTLGDALREVRTAGGLSRKDLSETLAARESVLEKWEAGVSLPSLEEFEDLKTLFPGLLALMGGAAPDLVSSKGKAPVLGRPSRGLNEMQILLSEERGRAWVAWEAWYRAEAELAARIQLEEARARLLVAGVSPEEIVVALKAAGLFSIVERLLKEAEADDMTCKELRECLEAFE